MYATWSTYNIVTNMGVKKEVLRFVDPGFGTNSNGVSGDSRKYVTSSGSGTWRNRMIPVSTSGAAIVDGGNAFGAFGARPALYITKDS